MCDPVSAGMFALSAASQVAQHQQARSGVKLRNRQRLSQFDAANENYEVEVMLNNNVWKNDVIVNEYEEQEVFMAMQSQWQQYDAQLDQLFAEADFKLQDSLIKMYKNEYAGEGTGVTAGRRAAQSAREHGFRVAEETSKLILNMEDVELRRESIGIEGNQKINALFEKVRFPPVPGQTPIPPSLEAMPSSASLFLGLAGSALSAYGFHKLSNPVNPGMNPLPVTPPGPSSTVGALQASGQLQTAAQLPVGGNLMQGHFVGDTFIPHHKVFTQPVNITGTTWV